MDAGASAIAITANTGFTQLGGPITTTNSTANAVQISTTGGNASIRAISTGLGGAVTILGACRVPEFTAAVCFYGLPPETVAKPADIKVPLQAHFANRDDWCTPEAVDKFEAGLKAAAKKAEIFRYDADNGFVNEQRDAHDRAAAELAWERTLAFWSAHLGTH